MSHLTYSPSGVRAGVSSHRSVLVWVSIGAAIVGALFVLALSITDSDTETSGPAAPSLSSPDVRFDGGPNEGTRGAARSPLGSHTTRFDGGPEEGSRGAILHSAPAQAPVSATTRFDGGPEEGTRGVVNTQAPVSATTRFDGGPEEGTRGR